MRSLRTAATFSGLNGTSIGMTSNSHTLDRPGLGAETMRTHFARSGSAKKTSVTVVRLTFPSAPVRAVNTVCASENAASPAHWIVAPLKRV